MTRFNTSIEEVARAVCLYYDVTLADMSSLSRKAHIVRARAMYFYMCKKYTIAGFTTMAKYIERNHATAIHHANKFEYMTKDEQKEFGEIKNILFDLCGNPILESFNTLGRYFGIIKDVEFAIWN